MNLDREFEQISKGAEQLQKSGGEFIGIANMISANEIITKLKDKPTPPKLFKEFWYTGEVSCLFADSNAGKSILATQIADEISQRGEKVLLLDLELSPEQFVGRYRYVDDEGVPHPECTHKFSRNLIRPDKYNFDVDDIEDAIIDTIEQVVKKLGIAVVIVDNLTFFLGGDAEKGAVAKAFVRKLKTLKEDLNISILVIGHTPKRSPFQPITLNDLAGSKNIANLIDSAFALAVSVKDPDIRYIKQVKVRYGEIQYGGDSVLVVRKHKPTREDPMLKFVVEGTSTEREHLKDRYSEDAGESNVSLVKELHNEGKSLRQIADITKLSKSTVENYLKR